MLPFLFLLGKKDLFAFYHIVVYPLRVMWKQAQETFIANWPYIVSLFLLLAGTALAIVTIAVSSSKHKKFVEELERTMDSSRIFIIDIRSQMVRDFVVTAPHAITNPYPLADFYHQFPPSEQKRVIQWVNAVSDPETSAPDYLETDTSAGSSKTKTYFSMLQVDSFDPEQGILHLRSYLLKSMETNQANSRKPKNRGLASMKQYQLGLKNGSKRKGATLVFHFAYRRIQDKDKPLNPLVMKQVQNAVSPLVTSRRIMMQIDGNEFIIADFHIPGMPDGLHLAKDCVDAIRRYLAINGYATKIDFRVALVEHRLFPTKDDAAILEEGKRSVSIAFSNPAPIYFYEKGKESFRNDPESNDSYRTEVERIIHDNKIRTRFRPIYSVQEEKVFGYLMKSEPINTYFDSMDDLHDYAARTGDDHDLFATIARNSVPVFVNEVKDPDSLLFYNVRVEDRDFMLSVFARLKAAKSTHIVFLFKESDIRAHFDSNHPEDIVSDMKQIKAKGFHVGLLLEEGELGLPASTYSAYDYFVCSFRFAGIATNMDAKIRSKLHSLVEKLLRYNKPIIASDIEGWDAIEIIVRSGLKYISSEFFAPYDPMLNPIPNKSMKKVRDMRR